MDWLARTRLAAGWIRWSIGTFSLFQAPPLGTAWPNRLGRVGEGGGWRLVAALGWTGAGSVAGGVTDVREAMIR